MRPDAGYVDGPLAGMTVMAIGMTLAVGPLTAAVMGAVEPGHTGVASGVNNAVARVAGLLAIALLGLILSAVFVASRGRARRPRPAGPGHGRGRALDGGGASLPRRLPGRDPDLRGLAVLAGIVGGPA